MYVSVCVFPLSLQLTFSYSHLAEAYYTFEFRSNDIVLLSFVKSGSVWMKEILWNMKNLDDLHLADQVHIDDKVYFIDWVRED